MRAWSELEADFRALRAAGFDNARLDHTFGAAGETWRVAAAASAQQIRRFEALARMAGMKLLEVPVTAVGLRECRTGHSARSSIGINREAARGALRR